jgi:hypothetical protein
LLLLRHHLHLFLDLNLNLFLQQLQLHHRHHLHGFLCLKLYRHYFLVEEIQEVYYLLLLDLEHSQLHLLRSLLIVDQQHNNLYILLHRRRLM